MSSYADLQVAAPEYMSPDVVAKASPNIQNSFANVAMTPVEVQQSASHSANFNNAVHANVNSEPVAGVDNKVSGIQVDPTLVDNVERIGADVNMAQSPEMGSVLSGLFDEGCKALERNIEPVQKLVQPAPQVVPEMSLQPQDVKYTNEISAPSPNSMMA